MLLRVTIKNFLSFYEETTFDMFPNPKKKTFTNHIYAEEKVPLLKQAVIYGANGSGKSNLLKALRFIKDFATKKDFLNNIEVSKNKFRLTKDLNNKPIEFKIEFKSNDQYYIYNIELNSSDEEVKEKMFLSGLGKKEDTLIYSRESVQYNTPEEVSPEVINATNQLLKKNPYSSLIALNNEFPLINGNDIVNIYGWFKESLLVQPINRVVPEIIDLLNDNSKLYDFANHIFNEVGLGIKSIEIETNKLEDVIGNKNELDFIKGKLSEGQGIARVSNEKPLYSIREEDGIQMAKHFIFKQFGLNQSIGAMGIHDQSDGTIKLLNLIPALYNAITHETVICIDEIENSIHPELICKLVSYFSKSDSKGQLIFTTHETELLNQQKYMRPDEVWFTEKKEGNTTLYSLNNFKEHNTINIRNGYLDGRYGAIPFIGKLD